MNTLSRCSLTVIKTLVIVCYLLYLPPPISYIVASVTAMGCDLLLQTVLAVVVHDKPSPTYLTVDVCSSVVYVVVIVIRLIINVGLCKRAAVGYHVVTLLVVVVIVGRRVVMEVGYNNSVGKGILRCIVVMLFAVLIILSSLDTPECVIHYRNYYFLPVSFCILLSYGVTTAFPPSVGVIVSVAVLFTMEVGSVVYSMVTNNSSIASVVHLLLLGALLLDSLEMMVRKKYEEEKEGKEENDASSGY